jgi:hypothetical protein
MRASSLCAYSEDIPTFGGSYFSATKDSPNGFDEVAIFIPIIDCTADAATLRLSLESLHNSVLKINTIGGGYTNVLLAVLVGERDQALRF